MSVGTSLVGTGKKKVSNENGANNNVSPPLIKDDGKVKLRRAHSLAKAEQITEKGKKTRSYQLDRPCHEARDSLFSASSGFNQFEGFINWGALILLLGGTRLFLENVLNYGIMVNPLDWIQWLHQQNKNSNYFHTPLLLLVSNIHCATAFALEYLMSKNKLSTPTGLILQIVNLVVLIFIPIIVTVFFPSALGLLGRCIICMVNTVVLMKLWSYIQVNYWCRNTDKNHRKYYQRQRSFSFRNLREESDDESPLNISETDRSFSYTPVEYPDNLAIGDLYYFLAAPTLCYELNFPRNTRIRKRFLLKRLLEVFILTNIIMGLFQQWIIPSVRNSFKPFSEMDYMRCFERILKLAIPNHLLWLTWFYLVFHSFLNLVGELLKFSDRKFYLAWWNAKDVGTFWRLWNMPVHKWCLRHLYIPLLKWKKSRLIGLLAVFLFSAFFHEYVVSVPLQMFKIQAFFGMLMQVPLIIVSAILANYFGNRLGNMMVWASLILGQPVAIMVYYHDYMIENYKI